MFGSKKYYDILVNKMSYSALPHSKVIKINKYQGIKDDSKLEKLLYDNSLRMFKIFNKIIIKKGYSYEGKQVQFITPEIIKDIKQFRQKIKN